MTTSRVLVTLTTLVASLCYVGAVTQSALWTMVLPGAVVCALVGFALHSSAVVSALVVAGCSLGVAEAVNVLSGDYQGSVARSTVVAGACAGWAALLARTRYAPTFLVLVVLNTAWALALGAGGRVLLVALATGALGVIALGFVEREKRSFVGPPRLLLGQTSAVVLVVAAALSVALFQRHHDHRQAASPFRDSLSATIEPPSLLALSRNPPRSATEPVVPVPVQPTTAPVAARSSRLVRDLVGLTLCVIALLVVLVVLAGLRRTYVRLAWWRYGRRLRREAARPELGAWAWATAGLARLSRPLPPYMSPDLVTTTTDQRLLPLRALASMATAAAFSREAAVDPLAWEEAGHVVHGAWAAATRWQRLAARWRTPRSALDRG